MGILAGKRILVTGVLTSDSIAFHVARLAQEEGAEVVLTGFGRLSLVERIAKRLPTPAPVLELDVTDQGHLDSLADRVREHVDGLDGVVHAIGFAPVEALGGNFLNTGWKDVSTALQVSTYSLKAVAAGPLRTIAAKGIPGFEDFEATWNAKSPLGWKADDIEPAARATVGLLSDWFPATTGEIVHADGGFHAMGD
jgi:enoyl-[acyl-carrier protein] reductase I